MHKRARGASISSDSSDEPTGTPSPSPEPSSKVWRRDETDDGAGASTSELTCSLPPTCHAQPQIFTSRELLDAHQQTFHAHKCTATHYTVELASSKAREKSREGVPCDRVFPYERLLMLHQTECHDTVAKLREERGEKIFACFVPTCTQLFSTPRKRRLHLIDKHAYPKTYFFGVTLHGVADVLAKGGGMVRRDWKSRDGQISSQKNGASESGSNGTSAHTRSESPEFQRENGGGVNGHTHDMSANGIQGQGEAVTAPAGPDMQVDELAEAMGRASIGLVPRSVARKMQNKKAPAMSIG